MKERKPALGFIFVTLLLEIIGFGLLIPILPKLIEQMEGGNVPAAAQKVGLLTLSYAAMQFLMAPVLGSVSDRFGRRPVILVSLFGSSVDYLMMALAPTLPWFFLGRLVNGLSGASISVATAYIADISPPEKRAANFGMIGAAFGVGFILGPALGGWLGVPHPQLVAHLPAAWAEWLTANHLRIPFYFAAVVTLANGLYGFFVLPESLPRAIRRPFSWSRSNPVGSLVALGRYPVVARLAAALFLSNVAQFMLHSIWALYTGHRYAWTPQQIGLSLAFVGLMSAVVQGGLARKIIPRLGEARSVLVGLTIGAISYIGYAAATQGWMLFPVLGFACLGGIGGPALQGAISRSAPADEQGAVQGSLTGLASLGQIIAPLASTQLFAYFIAPGAPLNLPGAPFLVSSALMLGALAIATRTFRTSPSDSSAAKTRT